MKPWEPNAPVVSPFGGSLQGATTEEVQRAAIRQNPMRLLVRRTCSDCGHAWQQPAITGACPRCHSANTVTHHAVPCMAQRV